MELVVSILFSIAGLLGISRDGSDGESEKDTDYDFIVRAFSRHSEADSI